MIAFIRDSQTGYVYERGRWSGIYFWIPGLSIGRIKWTFSSSSPVKLILFTLEIVCSIFKIFDKLELETYLYNHLYVLGWWRVAQKTDSIGRFMNIPECREVDCSYFFGTDISNQIFQIIICLFRWCICTPLSSPWPPKIKYSCPVERSVDEHLFTQGKILRLKFHYWLIVWYWSI